MKLIDVLPAKGIFQAMDAIKPFPWDAVVTPEQLDVTFLNLYTNKEVSRIVLKLLGTDVVLSDDAINTLAVMLTTMYREKWETAYSLFLARTDNLGRGYKEVIEETINHDNSTTDAGTVDRTGTQEGKVSGFNSVDYQDKDLTNDNSKETRDLNGTDKGTQERTSTRSGYTEGFTSGFQNAIKVLQTDLLYAIIFVDVNSVLTLHIYD